MYKNQTSICQKGYLKISEWSDSSKDWDDDSSFTLYSPGRYSSAFPRVLEESATKLSPNFGEFCGSMIERSVTFFSQGSNVSVMAVVPSRASIPSTSFSLYLTYRFLKRRPFQESEKQVSWANQSPTLIVIVNSLTATAIGDGYTARIVLSQPNDYKISVPTGRATSTSGTSFLLSTDCLSGDSVRIYDGPSIRSPQLLEFCGSGSLPEIVSSGNEVLVQIYSAPYQHLSNSRVEIEVSVRYEMVQEETPEDNGRCFFTLDGTKRRWGLIHSPRHTMPPNTNCTYKLIGASKYDRIWLYFVSFFVLVEKQPTATDTGSSCSVSKLEIYDVDTKDNVSGASSLQQPSHLFCGETGPRLCAHAADYPPKYLPPRPCEVPNESYLSVGSEMIIRHRFLSFASELLTSSTSSFTARYEFIDTNQQGTQIDHSQCDRRIDSRLGKKGAISNPRDIFLYGRGGRHNLTCMFHFVGLPTERVRLTLKKARLKSRKSLCKSYYDPVFQRHGCRMIDIRQGIPQSQTWSLLGASEHWAGYSSPVGCVCDISIEKEHQAMTFESVVSNVKLNFEVFGMSHLEDFEDYFFEIDYEFVNYSLCDIGLRRHSGLSGEGILSFQSPSSQLKVPSPKPIRCRWKIEASPHKHLYLKFKGFNASASEECQFGTRILVYLDPREKPIANACIDSDKSGQKTDELMEFDIFSHTWYNESRDKIHEQERDRLFVEMVAPHDSAAFVIQWLEVTRPFVRTQSGQTLRNVDCLFECPEIGACIDPELWCDGTVHCPSGFDESPDHCKYFPVTYVSCAAAGIFITVLVLIWFAVRRRRLQKLLKKKDIRQFPPDDYCVESPIG
ncbi:uncharacterized protein CDAR_583371 [Caerostris darwini]|uniref:CUB domain-containing protein n=1 Tax=Caerostris darwini TaxID=1538125 RepID=A0AAV4V8M2_9ARAC|nr:uncharacterized protein CDAR_583371 [Caerostris darwini]